MADDAPRATIPDPSTRSDVLLDRLVRRTRWIMAWEAAWPLVARAALPLGLIVALAWLGILAALPMWLRLGVAIVLGLVAVVALVPLARLAFPTRRAALARLDAEAGRTRAGRNRPATALADRLAGAPSSTPLSAASSALADPVSRALWATHQRAAALSASTLRVGWPRPALAQRDPHALRVALLLALVVGFVSAGPERLSRLVDLASNPLPVEAAPAVRVDAWVTPPPYTRRPPVVLARGPAEPIAVPQNSTLVVRVAGDPTAAVTATGAAEAAPAQDRTSGAPPASGATAVASPATPSAAAPGIVERRFVLRDDAAVSVRLADGTAGYRFSVIPDRPPTITLDGPVRSAPRGGMTLAYQALDDYGVASVEADIALSGQAAGAHPLYDLPKLPLPVPANRQKGSAQATRDLSDHPFAGAPVSLTLVARDDAGQEGRSAAEDTTLPGRVFLNPLARALVEQRRTLALDARQADAVVAALDALMIAPEQFTPDMGIYLGLRTTRTRLADARGDDDLRSVADALWQMALHIEDGSMSQAERQLKAAREALRQALERGASPEEIQRLTREVRQALDQFLQEYARREREAPKPGQRQQGEQRVITQRQLEQMMEQMEKAGREGRKEDAQQLLSQLDDILQNLQSPNQQAGQPDPSQQAMQDALDGMGDMIRRQQQLRDQTFRRNRDEDDQQGQGEGQPGQDQAGQGQAGQGQDQGQDQGQEGDQGAGQDGQQGGGQQGLGQQGPGQQGSGQQGSGQQPGQGGRGRTGQGQGAGQSQGQGGQQGTPSLGELRGRQKALGDQLGAMRRRLQGQGAPDAGLGEAEEAMRDAEGQLDRGDASGAVASQGRAIDAMRKGAQNLAQALQDGDGQPGGRPGRAQRMGQGNEQGTGDSDERDPAGRPMRSRGYSEGSVKVPGRGETEAQRAARVTEELRKRFADPSRPKGELDYIGRLLGL